MASIALPRWVVGFLVAACAVSVMAVAFLLGRVTAPAPSATPATLAVGSAGSQAPAGAADAPRDASAQPSGAAAAAGHESDSGTAATAVSPVGAGPAAAAVAAYFSQMDAVAAEAKVSQDPQALARSVLDQAMSGNTGAIDGLIATQRSLQTRLGEIVPPPSCREHHQRSLRLFGRAIALLERTRDAMSGQGASDLGGAATEGRAIEAEAKALDALANDLRRAAGLARVS